MSQLIVLGPGRFLAIAVVVFAVWRVLCRRSSRRRGASFDLHREAVVVLTFGWSLVVASLVFFPLTIILYDWHGTLSLIPLKSTIDLIRYSTASTALKNIGGNVLLFVPFGVLLPLLFEKLRRPWPLLWRAAVMSACIELLQIPTQVRATDVDDVIWNVVGALLGLALFYAFWSVAGRSSRVKATGERLGAGGRGEPLLAAAVPIAVTFVLTVAVLAPTVVSRTLDESHLLTAATSDLSAASVVGRTDLAGYTFVVAKGSRLARKCSGMRSSNASCRAGSRGPPPVIPPETKAQATAGR